MRKNGKSIIAKTLVLAMAVTAAGVAAPEADAAKKPALSKKKVSVAVKKKATVTVKNVKAKKVKKLTVTSAKKSIATVKKNSNTKFTITGKKAGNTTVTAKVKVGTKTTTLKVKVTVTKAAAPAASEAASATPAATATVTPTTAPTGTPVVTPSAESTEAPYVRKELKDVKVTVDEATDPETMKESNARIQSPEVAFEENFENMELTSELLEADMDGDGEVNDYQYKAGSILSGRGAEKFEIADGGVDGSKCLKITDRYKFWHGVRINLEEVGDIINKGGTYKFSAKVKIGDTAKSGSQIVFSEEVKTIETASEAYNDMDSLDLPSEWTEITGTFSVPDAFYHYAVYIQTNQGATQTSDAEGNTYFPDIYIDDVQIECLDKVSPLENLTSIYETYKDTIPYIGTACSYAQILGKECVDFMKSQYNCVTPGNEMKPDAVMGTMPEFLTIEEAKAAGYYIPEGYETDPDNMKNGAAVVPKLNFDGVDEFLKAASAAGLKVRPHTLVWHEQTPVFFFQKEFKTQKNNVKNNYNVSAETMNKRLEFYIRTMMKHLLEGEYADCIYAIDVVNEYFHSHEADQRTKPTYYEKIYGTYEGKKGVVEGGTQSGMTAEPSYVKLAFKIAHEELVAHNCTNIKLFYNDFNTYDVYEDICHLVNYVNNEEKLMDGVGMQSHLDLAYPSVELYKYTLEFFRVNIPDVEVQITEIDATMNYNSGKFEDKGQTDKQQGAYYYDLMKAILQEKKAGLNVTGIVFWSLYDGVSWRPAGTPCIFNGLNSPKSAYYAVLDAKDAVK